ncbi:MAG: 50S ribosomal protein L4, partial [bacterium]|nr:50S ribosomal protein L4 [bacterium]
MKADTYTQDGKKKGSVEIPEAVFGAPWNPALVHQVVISMLANERTPVAHTKDRSEVRGGGKKPWKQKHTG